MKRFFFGLALLLLLLAGGAAAWWHWRVDPRVELERLLSEALHRQVTIGALEVDPRGVVVLSNVVVANQPDFPGDPLLQAKRIELDVALSELKDGEIVGVARAEGIAMRLAKHGQTTNVEGIVRPRATEGRSVDLHLDLAIVDASLLLDDVDRNQSLPLVGVDVRLLLTNRDDAKAAHATMAIAEIGLAGLPVRDVALELHSADHGVEVTNLVGRIGEHGTLSGSGRILLDEARDWTFSITSRDVDLDGDVRRLCAAFFPGMLTTVEATAATGRLAATVDLEGKGLHWVDIRRTIAGSGRLDLTDVRLPSDSLLVGIAGLAGRPAGAFDLAQATVAFRVAEGWITLAESSAGGQALPLPISGRVSLEGALELKADLMPLVGIFGGGVYAAVARRATSLPVRIGGTLDKPELQPPSVRDAATSLLGGALRDALGGWK